MNSKNEKDKVKQLQDKCQNVLNNLLRDEDNKYCVDCDSKGPRWASWNIGVFLCIRCAGIHRNLGVHISRVKSVNLDTWTPEQVVSLQQMGNSRARAVYEANLPDNFRRPQNDLNLESFIRAKYEHKKYIAREWVPAPLPKVNWEKEIEEEMEKSKRKTKNVVEKKTLPTAATVEVPQLPKPKNSSPKPNRIVNKDNDDLLISQNGDDSFSNFLSSMSTSLISSTTTTTTTKGETEKTDIISEEESFFNQTLPTEKEKIQISKDSIMKLYATIPVNNFNQFHNPLGQPSYQANMPMYQNFGLNSSTSSTISSNPLNYQMPQYLGGQQFPNQCVGQQFPLPNQIQLPNLQMSMTNQLNQFGQQQPQPQQQQQQPFMNLQQQFGMMNMNGQQQQFQSSTTNTTTNNLWQ